MSCIRQRARHPTGQPCQVGVVGFCMGGALSVAAAALVDEVDACVCFYGAPGRGAAVTPDPALGYHGYVGIAIGGMQLAMGGRVRRTPLSIFCMENHE